MSVFRKVFPSILAIVLIMASSLALAGSSTLANGYLSVPRIDIEGYGPMELIFRLEFNEQYLLVLEEAVETSSAISNSGIFDPVQ